MPIDTASAAANRSWFISAFARAVAGAMPVRAVRSAAWDATAAAAKAGVAGGRAKAVGSRTSGSKAGRKTRCRVADPEFRLSAVRNGRPDTAMAGLAGDYCRAP